MEEEEIWKTIEGFSQYEVSTHGNVRRVSDRRLIAPTKRQCLKGYYLAVSIKNDSGRSKLVLIHRLSCLTFIGWLGEEYEVNHIDGVKHNNRLSNLEWVTRSQNIQHSYSAGLRDDSRSILVTDHEYGITTCIPTMSAFARFFGVTKSVGRGLIRHHGEDKYLDRYTFRFNPDDIVIPRRCPHHRAVKGLNYLTRELVVADVITDLEMASGIGQGTILWNLKHRKEPLLVKGWCFLYMGDERDFPRFPKKIIEMSLKYDYYRINPLLVKDTVSDTIEIYCNSKEFADIVEVDVGKINVWLRKRPGEIFLDRYYMERLSKEDVRLE